MKNKKVGRPKGTSFYDSWLPQVLITSEMRNDLDLYYGKYKSVADKIRKALGDAIKTRKKLLNHKEED